MNAAANLPDDIDALKAIILAQREQNARLEALVAAFKQAMFGRKSEKIDPDQLELALEDVETLTHRLHCILFDPKGFRRAEIVTAQSVAPL